MKFKHYDWMLQVTWQVTTNQSVLEYDLALKIQWYQNPAQNLSKNVRKRVLESKNHFRLRRTRTEAFWRQGARANHRAAVPSCQEVLLRLKSKHLCICLSLSLSLSLGLSYSPKLFCTKCFNDVVSEKKKMAAWMCTEMRQADRVILKGKSETSDKMVN